MKLSELLISKISQEIAQKYQSDQNVLAIFLIGSAAKKTYDHFSDIDFFIITDQPTEYLKLSYLHESVVAVEILFNSHSQVKTYLAEEEGDIF